MKRGKNSQRILRSSQISPEIVKTPELENLKLTDDTPTSSSWTAVGKCFRFNEIVRVGETWSSLDYERRGVSPIPLTPLLAYLIRLELNEAKEEMEVHEGSRHLTQFYKT